jgi:hypothetical protein
MTSAAGRTTCARLGSSQVRREVEVSQAQEYISAFRGGEEFVPPVQKLVLDGRPDPAALAVFAREIPSLPADAAESVARLLADLGVRTDPLQPVGAEVIRDEKILELLVAIAQRDAADVGREAALNALRTLATPEDLSRFAPEIVRALEVAPSDEALLLAAKVKPPEAAPLLDDLAGSPRWDDSEALAVARAAFGAEDLEERFLQRAVEAEAAADGGALSSALQPLAWIGTRTSLRAVAQRLRTPLTVSVPGAFEKSVRVDVLDALRYAFPAQPELYPNNIIRESDYTRAERFCTEILGVTFDQPAPPFLTYRGYPMPPVPP